MNGKGNCYDNAAVETLFKTIKAELIWQHSWETRRQAEMAIFEYINGFYNPRRWLKRARGAALKRDRSKHRSSSSQSAADKKFRRIINKTESIVTNTSTISSDIQ
jgi:hypothetical protein